MNTLILFKLEQEGVESFEVVGRRIGVEVENGGEREAEEQVVCCAAGCVAWVEGGETCEVRFGKEERVEPVYTSFMSVQSQRACIELRGRRAYAFRR